MPNDWNEKVISEFRSNDGRVGGNFAGAPLLLLTTRGAKSGREHTVPVMYHERDGRIMVFASYAGADTDPQWYRNLMANPEISVEIGTDKFAAKAVVLDRDERDEVYASQAEKFPTFGEYQSKTERIIPVVELVRA